MTLGRARKGSWLSPVALALVGLALAQPAHAQVGSLMGSTSGSYCKFKKKNVIRVTTMLPLERSETFTRQMTLRRLASMARSKGFSAIVVSEERCGTLLINRVPRVRQCKLEARMESMPAAPADGKRAGEPIAVDQILRDTDTDAPSYPTTTGLMNHGNQCVIE
jgi:hypothetical protein